MAEGIRVDGDVCGGSGKRVDLGLAHAIADLSRRFIGAASFDVTVIESLKKIGLLRDACRVCVFYFRDRTSRMDCVYEWCRDGVEPQQQSLQDLPSDRFPWWMARLRANEPICIADVSALPAEADAERRILEARQIRSLLVLPLHIDSRLGGFIGFDSATVPREWQEEDIALLSMFAGVLGQAVSRERGEALRVAQEEKYRALFTSSNDAIVVHDLNGGILDANAAALDMFGYSRDELTRLNVTDLHPKDALETSGRLFEVVRRNGQIKTELVFCRKQGEPFTAELSASLFHFQGAPYVQGILRDITMRRQIEEDLRESEVRFRELADNIREVFWVFDVRTRKLVYVSPAYETVWGRRVEDLYRDNREWERSIHPEDREYATKSFEAVLEGRHRQEREYRIVRPDGQVRWVSDRATGVPGEAGAVRRVVGIAEDITERRAAEEKHARLAERLHHSQKMEAIGELAGGIAHDFNNILAAVHGNAELIEMTATGEDDTVELACEIRKSSRRAADLTKQLLAFAQKGRIRTEPVDLHEVVMGVESLLRRSVDRRIAIRTRLSAARSIVLGDRSQLETALLNLGLNARDAMPEGGELVFASSNVTIARGQAAREQSEPAPGMYVMLEVKDTGCGIAEEIADRIFEPFFTTKPQGKGTGLGLAGVYGCVTSHKGTIRAESHPGQGSVFTVLLPAGDAAPGAARAAVQGVTTGAGHILVVDDERELRTLAARALGRLGYRVSVATDGREALSIFEEERAVFDLVILDLVMPRLSGYDAFPLIRKLAPEQKVLLCSGYNQNQNVEDLLAQGAAAFLPKPFALDDLAKTVGRLIGGA